MLFYYDMHDFLSSCVDAYCDLAKVKRKDSRKASTPFHDLRIARPRENEEQPDGCLKGVDEDSLSCAHGALRPLACNSVLSF